MGRYGNVMLVNGETRFAGQAAAGEVVRLNLVNTANTRIFNVALPGARMKLVGGDSGRCEHDTFVDAVRLAPSERAIVDVLFETPGDVLLEHRPPGSTYDLGSITVTGTSTGTAALSFDVLRTDPELAAEREALGADLEREPDEVLGFTALMPLLYGAGDTQASSYTCPMHPEIVMTEPGTCPKCLMKLIPSDADPASVAHGHGDHGDADTGDGLEWEDLMVDINRQTDTANMVWKLVDRRRGDENMAIRWAFAVGDRVKIRLVNEIEGSEHPMHHPFHIHGAGRFLVLARDGVPEENLVWKDTVLVPAGQTVDIRLDVTHPGRWMAHCHIAEHNQSGMMFVFDVARAAS
jgi:FtsP/CotA-like multicopper oxidase with cupredoxin domain